MLVTMRPSATVHLTMCYCTHDALQSVEAASRAMQHELSSTTELLAADTGRISRDLAAVRADVSTLGAGLQQQQHELGVLQPRLGRLEALEFTNPRASLRLVTALEGKVDNLAAQQVRHASLLKLHPCQPSSH